MAFNGSNYWQTGPTDPIKRPKAPPPRPANLPAQPPSEDAKLAALVQEVVANNQANGGGTPWSTPYDPIKATLDQTAFIPGTDVPRQAPAGGTGDKKWNYVNANTPALGSSMKGVSSLIGDAASGISGIGALVAGAANDAEAAAANTPEAIYNRLRQQAGQYSYSGPSPEDMAAKEFDPQFALLDSLRNQANTQYGQNKADIAGMYKGLVQQQTQGRSADQANFQKANAQIGQNYQQATGNLTDSSTAYQQAMAKQLANLGIKEGTGDVVAGVGKNLQNNVARLNDQGANAQTLMSTLGANEYAADTANIGTAAQAGVNTQTQFLNDYMGKLAGYDQQGMQLTGQRGQAENNYAMQIQKLLAEGQGQQNTSINDTLKAILSGNQQAVDNQFTQAGLDLKLGQFDFQKQQADIKNQPAANAYDQLRQRALSLYKDPAKAQQVIQEVLAQYQRNPNATTVGDFLNGIDNQDALRADPDMTALIYDFASRVLPKKP